jgi:hypothetical protein
MPPPPPAASELAQVHECAAFSIFEPFNTRAFVSASERSV